MGRLFLPATFLPAQILLGDVSDPPMHDCTQKLYEHSILVRRFRAFCGCVVFAFC